MTGLKDFSTDAASNDVGAPPILWQEGQPAGTVNNSARALMAALACWRDDNSGILGATGGASGAYSLATEQGFTSADYAQAFDLAWTPDAANPGPCTFQPDAAGPKPMRRPGGAELAPGDIQVGQVYRVRWHPGTTVVTVVAPFIEQAGSIKAFASAAAVPPGWLPCVGSPISRGVYAALFGAIGTTWGVGDGSTTFNLPNFQGRTLFGADINAGLLTGAGGINPTVGSIGGAEAIALSAAQLASHTHTGAAAAAGAHDHGGSVVAAGQHSHGGATTAAGNHTHGGSTVTAGSHAHTGTTASAGTHGHPITYSIGTAGSGGTNRVVTDLEPNGSNNAGGATDGAGAHTHDFTTAASGDHSHGVTIAAVGDHAHGILADGQHAHAINVVADHTHTLTIDAAGSGAAHPNMPPGAVIVWAIKA
ncbi:tail fiber protein [Methylobacterium sp. WL30]|uniref:phage tail protein n=1 Tax=unclassified Methylobacterium TaxID=2615210 RepID=UPI0011CB4D9D|nr:MULTISPECIES: tail fiber protein [unclassified Methylobacterium]TXN40501.1 tail fiber protein [Methylobacterium sp. WL93]TXN52290.1 tail fiber protein [Methylobacterium sp. WL119]TXN69677.1 tail fiber protein [Methylobacterium sp. WL30]